MVHLIEDSEYANKLSFSRCSWKNEHVATTEVPKELYDLLMNRNQILNFPFKGKKKEGSFGNSVLFAINGDAINYLLPLINSLCLWFMGLAYVHKVWSSRNTELPGR